ncbi:MAG: hypothetical protein WCD42_00850 [Rhizomicrobium sp.]
MLRQFVSGLARRSPWGQMAAKEGLEDFITEALDRYKTAGVDLAEFNDLRARYGTEKAISALVIAGEKFSGFKRLCELGLTDHSLEAAAIAYPDRFSDRVVAQAQSLLQQTI